MYIHTHTHIYIYIFMYMYVYIYGYVGLGWQPAQLPMMESQMEHDVGDGLDD